MNLSPRQLPEQGVAHSRHGTQARVKTWCERPPSSCLGAGPRGGACLGAGPGPGLTFLCIFSSSLLLALTSSWMESDVEQHPVPAVLVRVLQGRHQLLLRSSAYRFRCLCFSFILVSGLLPPTTCCPTAASCRRGGESKRDKVCRSLSTGCPAQISPTPSNNPT